MGLDCSHGAFNGAYSAFNRLRQYVAACMGGSWPPHADPVKNPDPSMWYYDDEFPLDEHPGLRLFMNHSDCDGEFSPEEALQVATDLRWLMEHHGKPQEATGHLGRAGPYMPDAVLKFADGCQRAHDAGEPLRFC